MADLSDDALRGMEARLATEACWPADVARQLLAEVRRLRDENTALAEGLTALLEDRKASDGTYPHLVWCNGSNQHRIGDTPLNEMCNCPLGKRIRRLRVEAEVQDRKLRAQEPKDDFFARYFPKVQP